MRNWGTPSQRQIAAHLISLLFLTVVAGWFERSPTAFLPFVPAQIFWLIVDKAREQPNLIKRRSKRRRSSQAMSADSIGRTITGVVGAVTAAYLAIGATTFVDQAYGYAQVYLIDPGQGFRRAVRTDVVYALGKPDFTRAQGQSSWEPGGQEDNPDWLYKNLVMHVRFDPANGFVTSLSCQEDHPLAKESCPNNLGIRVGDHEDDLYDELGAPTSESLLADGKKVMRYQDIGHDFVLERFQVKSVRLYPDNTSLFSKLPRMLVWMIP